jgi:hypothetical protein
MFRSYDHLQAEKQPTLRSPLASRSHTACRWNRGIEQIPVERPRIVGEVSANFWDRGCHMIRKTDTYGRILGFLDRNRYYFFQVAPQLYSLG